jgi:hypothetical protein
MIRFTMPVQACSPGVLHVVKTLVEAHPGDETCVLVVPFEAGTKQLDIKMPVDGCLELVDGLEALGFVPEMVP